MIKLLLIYCCFLIGFTIHAQSFEDKGTLFGFDHTALGGVYGCGLSFYDFNKDGWDDLTFGRVNDEPLVYLNNEGTFEILDLNLPIIKEAKSIHWVDIDNDGDQDLYIGSRYEGNFLFLNNGDMEMIDISNSSGFFQEIDHEVFGACWGDYNGDHLLDVYICNYNWNADFAQVENYLYKNNGDGTFVDVTESAGVGNGIQQTFMATWVDFNRDGLLDISLINDRIVYANAYYENNGDGTFTDISSEINLDVNIEAMSNTWGDYDNDGLLDLYLSASEIYGGNFTLKNTGNDFINFSSVCETEVLDDCWGANWMDFDNDMDQDLYVAVGYYFPGQPSPNHFFINEGESNFTSAQSEFPNDDKVLYTNAIGDYNNDGLVDMATVTIYTDYSNFWENVGTTENQYAKVSLEGTVSNRDGVGSWIELWAGGTKQTRFTYCGEDYMAQDSQREIFGLGTNTIIDSLQISWPSGWVDIFYELEPNDTYHIVEGSSFSPVINYSSLTQCTGDSIILSFDETYTNFIWSTDETTDSITLHESESVELTATNDFGFTGSIEVDFEFFPNPEIASEIYFNPCYGDSLASISLNNTSETGYTINIWNSEILGPELTNLPAGEYAYNFVDENLCSAADTIYIIDPPQLYSEVDSITNVSCFEACDGSATLNFGGGTPEYDISGEQENLCAGTYEMVLSDANGCIVALEYEILEPEELEVSVNTINAEEGENGSALIEIIGGTEPYFTDWGELNNESLPLGTYSILVTDANNCSSEVTFDIFVGIEELSQEEISIYPNPCSDFLYLSNVNANSETIIRIYDLSGKIVLEETYASPHGIDVRFLALGSYILEIQDKKYSKKLIISKQY